MDVIAIGVAWAVEVMTPGWLGYAVMVLPVREQVRHC